MNPQELQSLLERLIKRHFGVTAQAEVSLADPVFGDYTTNVAFQLARQLKQSPLVIAQTLADQAEHPAIAGVQAAGAGYLNITLHNDYWIKQLTEIKSGYGQSRVGQGIKVQVEFISANPTGPLTLGNGRGGYWGDVLANVLSWSGYETQREYYINDAGNQVQQLKESVWFKISEKLGQVRVKNEPGYVGEYIEEIADEIVTSIKAEVPDNQRSRLSKDQVMAYIEQFDVLGHILGWIRKSVKAMGIDFDVWFSESTLHPKAVDQVIKALEQRGLTEDRAGALWLKLGGKAKDRVLRRRDGSPTYLASDLAYHWDKFVNRGFDRVINLWGFDHVAQVDALKQGVERLGIKGQLEVILFMLVRLMKDGKEVKASKRAGVYVTIDELLEQIDPAVARFFFLMRSNKTPMDFDLNLAKEQSQKNPYFYIMYAYVRAQSILSKAKTAGIKASPVRDLVGIERQLARKMLEFPQLVEQIAADFGVHRLTFYGQELARSFHDFYEQVPILQAKSEAGQHLELVKKFVQVMESYWQVLGVEPITKM